MSARKALKRPWGSAMNKQSSPKAALVPKQSSSCRPTSFPATEEPACSLVLVDKKGEQQEDTLLTCPSVADGRSEFFSLMLALQIPSKTNLGGKLNPVTGRTFRVCCEF